MAIISRKASLIKVLLVLLAIDSLFLYLSTFGIYSFPGQAAYFFFIPSIRIGDRLAWIYPAGLSPQLDVFVIQLDRKSTRLNSSH